MNLAPPTQEYTESTQTRRRRWRRLPSTTTHGPVPARRRTVSSGTEGDTRRSYTAAPPYLVGQALFCGSQPRDATHSRAEDAPALLQRAHSTLGDGAVAAPCTQAVTRHGAGVAPTLHHRGRRGAHLQLTPRSTLDTEPPPSTASAFETRLRHEPLKSRDSDAPLHVVARHGMSAPERD